MEARASSKADLPVLAARAAAMAERFAARMRGRHPAAVFFAALFTGLAVLVLASILLALLTTEVLVAELGLGGEDQDVVETIVDERTPFLTDVSEVGSTVGGAPVLPILVGLVALAAAFMRKWLIVGFAVFVLAVESATYRVTTIVVPRERPDVNRLEDLDGRRELPLRPRGRLIRGLRGPHDPAHVALPQPQHQDRRLARGDPRPAVRGALPHVPRHAPSARRGRRSDRGRRRRDRAAVRLPRGGRRTRHAHWRRHPVPGPRSASWHEGRGGSQRIQDVRQGLAGAAARPRASRRRRAALVRGAEGQTHRRADRAGARRGRRAVLRLGRRRNGAPCHWRARGQGRRTRRAPRGHRQPVRLESRASRRRSSERSQSGCAASAAASTSAAFATSASRSWLARASTRP